MSRKSVLAAVAASLATLIAMPAAAQTPPPDRAYVMGFGGAAMSTINAGLFGGSAGLTLGRDVQVFGEFGRMQDVLPGFTKEDLNVAVEAARADGSTFTWKSKVPTAYAIGGVRYLVPTGTIVRPYASVGAGVAHLMPSPTFVVDGLDITSAALQDPNMANMFKTDNRPLATVGAGITVNMVRHVKVDIGYKYSRIFVNTDYLQSPDSPHQHKNVDVHRLQLGLGFTF